VGKGERRRDHQLPTPMTFTVAVTDPSGRPVAGVSVAFTLSPPGAAPTNKLAAINNSGTAIRASTLHSGTAQASGVATGVVQTSSFGSANARAVLAIGN